MFLNFIWKFQTRIASKTPGIICVSVIYVCVLQNFYIVLFAVLVVITSL